MLKNIFVVCIVIEEGKKKKKKKIAKQLKEKIQKKKLFEISLNQQ